MGLAQRLSEFMGGRGHASSPDVSVDYPVVQDDELAETAKRLGVDVEKFSKARIAQQKERQKELDEELEDDEHFVYPGVDANLLKFPEPVVQDVQGASVIPDRFGPRYWIEDKLGQGGMGAVYEVADLRTDQKRAMKVLLNQPEYSTGPSQATQSYDTDLEAVMSASQAREILDNPSAPSQETKTPVPIAIERFRREVHTLAKTKDPFVLKAFDLIDISGGRGEGYALITDLIKGPDLEKQLYLEGFLPPVEAAIFGAEIAHALQTMHEQGIVHRDLKPGNIFIDNINGEEVAKVGDFGLATYTEEVLKDRVDATGSGVADWDRELTDSIVVLGTPTYMAPERIKQSEQEDHRADLYALGAILYKMVTGENVVQGSDGFEIMKNSMKGNIKAFNEIQMPQNVPDWLEDIIMKLLAANPDDRYQTAAEVFEELQEKAIEFDPSLAFKLPFSLGSKDAMKQEAETQQEAPAETQAAMPSVKKRAV